MFIKKFWKHRKSQYQSYNFDNEINIASEKIKNADAVLICAGAGMGVDSGLSTYRSKLGFHDNKIIIGEHEFTVEDFASPKIFNNYPKIAWGFYAKRLNEFRNTTPHEGYNILKIICEQKNNNYFIFTSNVDNHFQRAGFDENKIVECHGSMFYYQETGLSDGEIWFDENIKVNINKSTNEAIPPLPKCPFSDKLARPNTLFIGDWDWNPTRFLNQSKKIENWLNNIKNQNQNLIILEIGAGIQVTTVRRKSEQTLEEIENSFLIRVNPEHLIVPQKSVSIGLSAKNFFKKIQN